MSRAEYLRFEPFAYSEGREEELVRRGRDGLSHVLYAKSPGGVEATAARVERLRGRVEAAAAGQDVDADTLEALVFLESAGRADAIAGGDPAGAAGLGQILPGTATSLLDMRVDLDRSRSLTRSIDSLRARTVLADLLGRRTRATRRLARLERERRRVDERFDARRALAGAARYLAYAGDQFGRDDLAVTSYHMGVGNLQDVIALYRSPRPPRSSTRATVTAYEISYARLFFDSGPRRNPRTHRRLAGLGDDSRTYLFRLEAAREIMRLHREDREELRRLARLHGAKASAEEVLRPPELSEPFEDGDALREAYGEGELLALPRRPSLVGLRVDRRMGALAGRLDERRSLYRGLHPEALATLLYIAKETRRIVGAGALRVTSTVRDRPYQRLLVGSNAEATSGYSLHTVGFAVDIARNFRSRAQERALVHVLERLRALAVIDWVYEPTAIHLTVGPDGRRFLPLLRRLRD